MASIIEKKNKKGETISWRLQCCVGRDEMRNQIWRTKTIPRPEGLTPAREKKEVKRIAEEWEREQKAELQAEEQEDAFVDQLSVSLPNDLDEHARHNLDAVLAGKATLFKAAFQTESLAYDEDEKKLTFPWFKYSSPESMGDETNAYMLFLTKLVAYAKEAKRVTVKDKAVDNPRYAFRCFLLRLGFIGQEYKAARKILMRNLTGNSSWKDGHRKEAAQDEVSEQGAD